MRKRLTEVCLLSLVLVCLPDSLMAENLIVRSTSGVSVLQSVCRIVGCTVVRSLNDPLSQVFLVNVPNLPRLNAIENIGRALGIVNVEPDQLLNVIDRSSSVTTSTANAYANQPATGIVRASEARKSFGAQGRGVVAVIDTGIDGDHPALRGFMVPGYDYTRDQEGWASETADVGQSTAAVLDGPPFAAFGHGTMVAGVIHMIAPKAALMSLKAFRSDGTGYLSDIVRAVYRAAGTAQVINMSFSTPDYSLELDRALQHAVSRDLIAVSSAGNNGKKMLVYPAALPNTLGIASTDYNDRRSGFSNYGQDLVSLAAPGEMITSTFPYGSYASASGTSFSAPFVSGAMALLIDVRVNLNRDDAKKAVSNAKPIDPDLGAGRLDIYRALEWLRFYR
jgi:subtilisin family serine protease